MGGNDMALFTLRFRTAIIISIMGLFISFSLSTEVNAMKKTKHIILLGASVGEAWKIEDLPRRQSVDGYQFEYFMKGGFDKSEPLKQILDRKDNKPDAVFIKECAAYFPGDLPKYQELMKGWVTQCKQAGVIPIPTTVVPVIKDLPLKTRLKDLIKWVIGRPTQGSIHTLRLTGILEYNDWIKSYARKEGLVVLDLETPLHVSKEDRSLRLDLHSGDGLHLNEKAYAFLDKIVITTLEKAFEKK